MPQGVEHIPVRCRRPWERRVKGNSSYYGTGGNSLIYPAQSTDNTVSVYGSGLLINGQVTTTPTAVTVTGTYIPFDAIFGISNIEVQDGIDSVSAYVATQADLPAVLEYAGGYNSTASVLTNINYTFSGYGQTTNNTTVSWTQTSINDYITVTATPNGATTPTIGFTNWTSNSVNVQVSSYLGNLFPGSVNVVGDVTGDVWNPNLNPKWECTSGYGLWSGGLVVDPGIGVTNLAAIATSANGADVAYPQTFTTGGSSPQASGVTYSIPSGSLFPIGATTVTATATDNGQPKRTSTATFTVTVLTPIPITSPAITSSSGTIFTVGTAGSFTLATTGYPVPTFTESGLLPSGVSFSSSGILNGTPAAGTTGIYPITITANNAVLPMATQSFTLSVYQRPVITSANHITFTVGTAGSFSATATGYPATTFTEYGSLPRGVTFTTAGVLSGTPAAGTSGVFPIVITAANGSSPNATQNFTLTVSQVLGTLNLLEGLAAGIDSDIVTVGGSWTATSNASWLHTTSSGSGNGLATFTFDANPGATRTGTITIAGFTLTITQAGTSYTAANTVPVISGLSSPYGVAVDGSGNLYIADPIDNALWEWNSATGQLTKLISSGLSDPEGVAVDSSGNVYIADTYNNAIKEWHASTGTVTTLISSGLSYPSGVAVDGSGNVYIADTNDSAVKEWHAATQTLTTIVSTGLSYPAGVAVDASGNVYIADTDSNAIKEWHAATQTVSTLVSGLNHPQGVAVDDTGNIYIADTDNVAIKEWEASTQTVATLVSSGLAFPYGLAVDSAGNVYIADTNNSAIKKWQPSSHTVTTIVPPVLNGPSGMTVDAYGNLYISDKGSNTVKEWNAATQMLTTLVSYGLTGPSGLAVDGAGNVYIADTDDDAIKEWNATTQTLTTLVSVGLNEPSGVAVDSAGNVYIADTDNNAIKKWNASTQTVTTLVSSGLNDPEGMAVDAAGDVYIADFGDGTIKEWHASTQTLSTLVFSGLVSPAALALDGSGNVYIAETDNHAIEEWHASTQTLGTLVSLGPAAYPIALALDEAGNVYIADNYNNTIRELPRAYVPVGTVSEGQSGGSDALLAVLPTTQLLTGIYAPSSNQSWLTVGSAANGVVPFSFTSNAADAQRTATLTVLGISTAVNQAGLTPSISAPTVTSVTATSATLGGTVTSIGGATIMKRGVLYSLTTADPNPTLGGSGVIEIDDPAATTGTFSEVLSGLSPGTEYSFAAFATNSFGTSYTNPVSSFNTPVVAPTVTSATAASITSATAVLGGAVSSTGGATLTKRGILYAVTSTNQTPTLGGAGVTEADDPAATAGSFTEAISGLTPGTVYSFVAFATNSIGTTYTYPVSSFTSLPVVPTLTNPTVSSITPVLAILGGTVTSNGGAPLSKRGILFAPTGTNPDPTLGGIGVIEGDDPSTTIGSFTVTASGLLSGTTYSFAAFAVNSAGVSYTNPISTFSTPSALGTFDLLEGPGAGSDSDIVYVPGSWTSASNASWLHIASSGTGIGLATFSFDVNPGATRTGTMTIAGLTVTVAQAGSTYLQAKMVPLISGLNNPGGVAVNSSGSVFIADTGNNAIKEWNPATQTINTLVSSGLNNPDGVAVDGAGNVYIADTYDNAIKEWNPTTHTLTILVSTGLDQPHGVAVDGAGNVYIADTGDNAIKEWNASNQSLTTLVSTGLNQPRGVAVDGEGKVYIADTNDFAIKEWNAATQAVTILVSSGLESPCGVAVDGSGNVYIADSGDYVIKEWNASTQMVSTLVPSGLSWPFGVAVAGSDNLYIANTDFSAIDELPRTFVPAAAVSEGAAGGSDTLPVLVPSTQALTGVYAPSSGQSWLTIGSVANGVVGFSFAVNMTTAARTADITLLGQSITLTQAGETAPTVSSPTVTSISATTATLGGTVTAAGFPSLTNRGVLYAVTAANSNLTLGGIGVAEVDDAATTMGTFTEAISGLTPGTVYSFVAFATNSIGTSYTSPVSSFTTPALAPTVTSPTATLITSVSAALGGAVTNTGGATLTKRGILYAATSTNPTPTLGGVGVAEVDDPAATTGSFIEAISGLTPGTAYSFVAFATNSAGTSYTNPVSSFTTPAVVPTLTSPIVSSITSVSAILGGTVVGTGGATLTKRGILLATTAANPDPTLGGMGVIEIDDPSTAIGTFTENINGLLSGSSYSFVAFATNNVGVSYTNPVSTFNTPFPLATLNLLEGPGAGTDSDLVTALGVWTATSNNSWLHTTAGGSGSGLATFTFDANPGATRTGSLTIAGFTVTFTQAGSGYAGASPVPLMSGLSDPTGVAVDSSGNVYIADTGSREIKEWQASTQTLSTLVSSGLSVPYGVAVDGLGNVYIADPGDNKIEESRTATQTLTTLVSSGLNEPEGVALDSSGNAYIADWGDNAIKEWQASTQTLTTLVSSGLDYPSAVAVDAAGNVYIADSGHTAIKEWQASTQTVGTLVSSGLSGPYGVAVDGSGNVYIADGDVIKEWQPSTQTMSTLASSGTSNPSGVAVGGSGNVYIADPSQNSINELARAMCQWRRERRGSRGQRCIPAVLPATQSLTGVYAPSSDQSWLTIGSVVNGVVPFSYTANTTGVAPRLISPSWDNRSQLLRRHISRLASLRPPSHRSLQRRPSSGARLPAWEGRPS